MKSASLMIAAGLFAVAWLAHVAQACCCKAPSIQTPIQQAIVADMVVIGKVVGFEPDLIMTEQYPGSGKVAHMVAIVRIEESLLGGKGITHVRVGFVPSQQAVSFDEFGLQQVQQQTRFWRGPANLTDGQDACFFLRKTASNDLCLPVDRGYPLDKADLTYLDQLAAVRKILKSIDRPMDALQAKDASDRQLAACALVMKYRMANNGSASPTLENIPAAESKLILGALSEMKWGENPFDPNGAISLHGVFWQLQLSEQDGWKQPQQKENEDYNTVMSKATSDWFKANADKYRLQRFVVAKAN